MNENSKPEARLTNPQFVQLPSGIRILVGNVYNHPKFLAGQWIHTSEIVKQDGNRVETLNSVYTLEAD